MVVKVHRLLHHAPGLGQISRALQQELGHADALIRFANGGQLPVDNNWIENQIRSSAIGRNEWFFARSLHSGKRAAAVMSPIQSAPMNGHDPWPCIHGVLRCMPTHANSRIAELLPRCWRSMEK